jgi:hypothetical protein
MELLIIKILGWILTAFGVGTFVDLEIKAMKKNNREDKDITEAVILVALFISGAILLSIVY